jgi:hypothetical protein
MNRSFIMIKPDAVEAGLVQPILSEMSGAGLDVCAEWTAILDEKGVAELYPSVFHQCVAWVEGFINVTMPVYQLENRMADIDTPRLVLSLKWVLRKRYSMGTMGSLLHCPDSIIDYRREVELLWRYRTPIEKDDDRILEI